MNDEPAPADETPEQRAARMGDQAPSDQPQNQTQDVEHQIGQPATTATPAPNVATRVPSDPQPVSDAEPIDPNHPELPRRPRVTPPDAPAQDQAQPDDSGD